VILKFNDPTMLAAARGRLATLRWRLGVGVLFTAGSIAVLNSFAAGFSWYLVLCLAMLFDQMLAKSYVDSRGDEDRRTAGGLYAWGCFFSICVFAAMPIVLAAIGGGPGRVLGVLMAASSLVSVTLSTFQAPRFMLISSLPATAALLIMPLIPFGPGPADAFQATFGVGCGVAGFLAYMGRSAFNNTKMVAGWRAANAAAKERQLEAEVRRAEAEEANRAKSEFLAVMTHELRTPLNAVIGYAEIIQEDLEAEGRKELCDDAGRITNSARHLLGLIDQILNMSSMDAGHEGLALREVDVRKLIEDAVTNMQDETRAANNRISVRVSPDAEHAHTDGNKLAVSLSALISNAVKFTQNGLIAVTAEVERHGESQVLAIAVSDTGIGIAKEDLPRAFQPFTQIESATTRSKGGMGLGLSIAQRMAQALGGEITATSEFGSGSTFMIRLPMRENTAAPALAAA
jgi:signal transduction histidine kinase